MHFLLIGEFSRNNSGSDAARISGTAKKPKAKIRFPNGLKKSENAKTA
ncbi:MAG: hypothetical protein LBP54_03150 [Campylobacteraceae bacterium]|nr:hypothetical protein [Campylobacteraceae bacterium]